MKPVYNRELLELEITESILVKDFNFFMKS